MDVGMGLPSTLPGVTGADTLEWARRVEAGPFAGVHINDRLLYSNLEAIVTLSAVAAVTKRIGLMTSVILSPTRNAGILAKQAATLDVISNGRFTLGLGVGMRRDDFDAAPEPFAQRGRKFEQQLATLKRAWSGEPMGDGLNPLGPKPIRPGGPQLLIGARTPNAIARAGKWADGFISGGGPPQEAREAFDLVEATWRDEGRSGKPRFVAGAYFAIGDGQPEQGAAWIRDYYGFAPPMAEGIVKGVLTSEQAIRDAMQAFADIGVDLFNLSPTTAAVEQLEVVAGLVA